MGRYLTVLLGCLLLHVLAPGPVAEAQQPRRGGIIRRDVD